MKCSDFITYLQRRLDAVIKAPDSYPPGTKENLVSMLKIHSLGGEPARRVRRDYIRRLARQGVDINNLAQQ